MEKECKTGIILKGVGGFYTVLSNGMSFVCKARGLFRKQNQTPIVGDNVSFSLNADGETGYLLSIEARKNELIRPMVANIDKLFIVVSASKPAVDLLLVDKLLLCCEKLRIEPVLIINKCDDADAASIDGIRKEYSLTGYRIYTVSAVTGDGIEALRSELQGSVVCFAGQSAVGKSSLLNALIPGMKLEVGELSRKTERGRHTTRHAELIPIGNGGAVLDTPGFSLLENIECEPEEIKNLYPELRRHVFECRFSGCLHISEPGCVVKEEIVGRDFDSERYNRYVRLVKEAMENRKHKYE
ncbi:MAG: ribosome small subunit-dependent GTPase A [Eubacteriales bacterium]|nr:ribosome small subunit-dependent GTPase A [Eubacteriales bacterium]